jgi:hypothetical protein
MLLEQGVSVDAAKAEGVYPSPARLTPAVQPRPALAIEVEPRARETRVAVFSMKGRRQYAIMQGKRGLD